MKKAYYELYDSKTGSGTVNRALSMLIFVELTNVDVEGSFEKGILTTKNAGDFPILYQSGSAQFKLMVNGGLGLYHDENALFGRGTEFTQGNLVADDPAGEDSRFWLET